MNDFVANFMKRPDALTLHQRIHEQLEDERVRRQQFYAWIDENTKAEFINGQIIMHSPAKGKHLSANKLLSRLISVYADVKGLGQTYTEKAMISLTRNDYEPDIVFFGKEKAKLFTGDQVLHPAPDLVVEILSKRTEKIDRTTKKEDYAKHGICEYWMIDVNKRMVEQYILLKPTDTVYFEPYRYRVGEEITSKAIEGFTIEVEAIFDESANLDTLRILMS
jgi:Uma2 family endonuclease